MAGADAERGRGFRECAKPAEPETLKTLLKRSLEIRDAEMGAASDAGMVGKSAPIDKLRQQIAQFADAPFPVLIEGESFTCFLS